MIEREETAKARLTTQLAELEARKQRIADDLRQPGNPDLAEQAIEIEDDEALGGQDELIDRQIDVREARLGPDRRRHVWAMRPMRTRNHYRQARSSSRGGALYRLRSADGVKAPPIE